MNESRCKYCEREIVFVKRSDTHTPIALEKKRYLYTVEISPIGSTAYPVEAADGATLYEAHSEHCSKKEST